MYLSSVLSFLPSSITFLPCTFSNLLNFPCRLKKKTKFGNWSLHELGLALWLRRLHTWTEVCMKWVPQTLMWTCHVVTINGVSNGSVSVKKKGLRDRFLKVRGHFIPKKTRGTDLYLRQTIRCKIAHFPILCPIAFWK